MTGIQWSKAAWGGRAVPAADLPRSFTLPIGAPPLLTRRPAEPNGRSVAPATRTKLWELAGMLHCSVIGTCLTTADLRHLLVRLGLAQPDIGDHEAHKIGVTIAGRHDVSGKKLNKLLDERHRQAVTRFARAATGDAVRALWKQALQSADIPGSYWATLTHPAADHTLISEAFGDVHMLSHLVGAANRADIRRLRELEAERSELLERIDAQQTRLRDEVLRRDAEIRDLRNALAARVADDAPRDSESTDRALHALVADLERRLGAEKVRRQAAEQKLTAVREEIQRERALRGSSDSARAMLEADLLLIERRLPGRAPDEGPELPDLDGRTVLFVGGRPASLPNLQSLARQMNLMLLHHDGGIEDSDAILARLIARADTVLFPVDCVSHRAVSIVKRDCERAGKPFVPLRNASASAFLAGVIRLDAPTRAAS
jgi:hypothetical protein